MIQCKTREKIFSTVYSQNYAGNFFTVKTYRKPFILLYLRGITVGKELSPKMQCRIWTVAVFKGKHHYVDTQLNRKPLPLFPGTPEWFLCGSVKPLSPFLHNKCKQAHFLCSVKSINNTVTHCKQNATLVSDQDCFIFRVVIREMLAELKHI